MNKKVKNNAGGISYALPTKERLVTGVLTCFFNEPKSHNDTSEDLVKAARELIKTEPDFVAKLAVYARKEFHMRTISQVLAAEVAHATKNNKIVRKMVRGVIERPDDITNILAYYFDTFGPRKGKDGKKDNPVRRSLRRGIADAFHKFTEYHLAKYKGEKDLVKLRDALLIARPKPINDEQAKVWKRLIEGNLEVPETRETILSEKGQSQKVWEDMIDSNKLGFMAMLRNICNFLTYDISDTYLAKVIARLKNKKAVTESKQLPYRFFSAYKMVKANHPYNKKLDDIVTALDTSLSLSVANMPKLKGTTFMTADESGSMRKPISEKSQVEMIDIGNLMMALGDGFCEKSIPSVFGDSTKLVSLNKEDGTLAKMDHINKVGNTVGMSTKMVTAIDYIIDRKIKVDRIIVFSDMQAYDHSLGYGRNVESEVENKLAQYRKEVNPDVWVHSIDLSGEGTVKAKGPKVNLIAGWSERIFEFIVLSEGSEGNIIDRIANYQI